MIFKWIYFINKIKILFWMFSLKFIITNMYSWFQRKYLHWPVRNRSNIKNFLSDITFTLFVTKKVLFICCLLDSLLFDRFWMFMKQFGESHLFWVLEQRKNSHFITITSLKKIAWSEGWISSSSFCRTYISSTEINTSFVGNSFTKII